jgi:hypothetical protein
MAELSTFTFTSKELETVIETAVEKAVNRMELKIKYKEFFGATHLCGKEQRKSEVCKDKRICARV